MIDAKFADSQIKRLAGLDFFPTGKDAVKELVLALMVSETDAIAARVVTDFLNERTAAPKPAEIRQAAYTENERIQEAAAPEKPAYHHCPTCRDSGISDVDPSSLHSIAAYCACEVGRRRSRGSDPYSPEIVNAARAKLRKMRVGLNDVNAPRRRHQLTAVTDILTQIDSGRTR